ncbi:hypothetical protein QCA50_012519, partial [Cerrena zonata]
MITFLILCSTYITPSHRQHNHLPTEVCETIIDCIADIWDDRRNADLARCAHVCKSWVPRAQMCLFSFVCIDTAIDLVNVLRVIQKKRFLLQYIKHVVTPVDRDHRCTGNTSFLNTYHMPNLQQATIPYLDLKEVHPYLDRFPTTSTSLKQLNLTWCKTEDASRLGRFVTSFRSLSTLILTWHGSPGKMNHFPHLQFNRSRCSLESLVIQITYNISIILQCLIQAPPFLTRLKYATFLCPYPGWDRPKHSPVRKIETLLHHCRQSIEEVTIVLGCYPQLPTGTNYELEEMVQKDTDDPYVEYRQFCEDAGWLDSLLSDESFSSLRKLRVIGILPKPIAFLKLEARNIKVDVTRKARLLSLHESTQCTYHFNS